MNKKTSEAVMVKEELGTISYYELEGSFEDAIRQLEETRAFHKANLERRGKWIEGVTSFSLSFESVDWARDQLVVYLKRPENEKEQNARLNKEKAHQAVNEANERKEFERLSKKYGKAK